MSNDSSSKDRTSQRPKKPPRKQRPDIWPIAVLVTVIAGGLFYFGAGPYKNWQAERAVNDFFEALQDKDVDTALEYVHNSENLVAKNGTWNHQRTDFLTADALNTDWEITDVSIEELDSSWFSRDEALVEVTIAAEHGVEKSNYFNLLNGGDGWVLRSPFTSVWFHPGHFGRLEINDHVAEAVFDDWNREQEYFLFPGVYEFFSHSNSSLENQIDPALILGREHKGDNDDVTELYREARSVPIGGSSNPLESDLVDEAAEHLELGIQQHVDRCVEAITENGSAGNVYGCELGATEKQLREAVGDSYARFRQYQWDIEDYPTAELEFELDEGQSILHLRKDVREPGKATLTVDATDDDGNDTELEFTCDVTIEHSLILGAHTGLVRFIPPQSATVPQISYIREDDWDEFFAGTSPCSLP